MHKKAFAILLTGFSSTYGGFSVLELLRLSLHSDYVTVLYI